MILAIIAVLAGLAILVVSADRFVEGAAAAARHFGVPALLIGVVIVGFGTSAPEMVVSAIASWQGNPGLALGNAYGSNITNIALILGVTALVSPIAVHSQVVRKELPLLVAVTILTAILLSNDHLGRADAAILIAAFFIVMTWSILLGLRRPPDAFGSEIELELEAHAMPLRSAVFWLIVGLAALVASSRLLVWGAVEIANDLGVSDLIIGLTVVALGTSLPELASSLIATRKGEHDIALGNVLGSNLFNTLAVVGIAGMIEPTPVASEVLSRDVLVMAALTAMLFVFSYGFRRPGSIGRAKGGVLLTAFTAYTALLITAAAT